MSETIASTAPANAVVWSEIPVTDMHRSKNFYAAVLQVVLIDQDDGPNPMAVLPCADGNGVSGHLYPGKPAPEGTGNTVHFAAPGTLEATMDRVRSSGGRVESEAISIPAGRFFYALDPDGNSIGFFEG